MNDETALFLHLVFLECRQQLLTPTPGDNVKWPNRSRIGRLTVPFKANNRQGNQLVHAAPQSRLNARSPRLNKPLSILLEEKPTISHDREMKRTQKNSKGSLCPATHGVLQHGSYGTVQSRTTADAIFGAQSPQKAIYMGSRAAELSETLSIADNHAVSYKEALSQALVELLLNDTLHALKNAEASKQVQILTKTSYSLEGPAILRWTGSAWQPQVHPLGLQSPSCLTPLAIHIPKILILNPQQGFLPPMGERVQFEPDTHFLQLRQVRPPLRLHDSGAEHPVESIGSRHCSPPPRLLAMFVLVVTQTFIIRPNCPYVV
ncbi:unnamed protein product [Mesocestoides corti]|uniref:Uncharacterized protein n=1 Tax=Mesocestoides corti TaxID=53468 RepID=A0A0R3U4L5_MESCO|nr:unnamed protein product [Mesocestoides corti]